MHTKVYEVKDQDVLVEFFGPNSKERPMATFAKDFGELIYSGKLDLHPDAGDLILLDGKHPEVHEYQVVVRVYDITRNQAILVVHAREYDGVGDAS